MSEVYIELQSLEQRFRQHKGYRRESTQASNGLAEKTESLPKGFLTTMTISTIVTVVIITIQLVQLLLLLFLPTSSIRGTFWGCCMVVRMHCQHCQEKELRAKEEAEAAWGLQERPCC